MSDLLDAPPLVPEAPAAAPLAHDSPLVKAWAERLGGIPARRIVLDPAPGTATAGDQERCGGLCELIDGTLVEKAASTLSSTVGLEVGTDLGVFLRSNREPGGRRTGIITGADGFWWVPRADGRRLRLRAPDVSYLSRRRYPPGGIPRTGYPAVGPDLVIEVLSPWNTAAEIAEKLRNFFAAGTVRAWVIDPETRTAEVYDRPEDPTPVPAAGTLDAGPALPGFTVNLPALFAAADEALGEDPGEAAGEEE